MSYAGAEGFADAVGGAGTAGGAVDAAISGPWLLHAASRNVVMTATHVTEVLEPRLVFTICDYTTLYQQMQVALLRI
jgi:hypothetical protein